MKKKYLTPELELSFLNDDILVSSIEQLGGEGDFAIEDWE